MSVTFDRRLGPITTINSTGPTSKDLANALAQETWFLTAV